MGWFSSLWKGTRKAVPTALDLASYAVPSGAAANGMRQGADVIRAIQAKREAGEKLHVNEEAVVNAALEILGTAQVKTVGLMTPAPAQKQIEGQSENAKNNALIRGTLPPGLVNPTPRVVVSPILSPDTMLLIGNIQDRIKVAQEYKALLLEIVGLEAQLRGAASGQTGAEPNEKTTGPVDSQR